MKVCHAERSEASRQSVRSVESTMAVRILRPPKNSGLRMTAEVV